MLVLPNLRAAEERLENLQAGGNRTAIASAQASVAQAAAQREADARRQQQRSDQQWVTMVFGAIVLAGLSSYASGGGE